MEKLLKTVYNSRKISSALKITSHAAVFISMLSYVAVIALLYIEEPIMAVRGVLATAIPFVIVSVARLLINAPRPYELYDFYEKRPKDKSGQSFPSRHVFSAFLVATVAYSVSIPLMIVNLVLGVAIAVSRVLLGMHFIRDVACGFLIGIVSGVVGILILM
jgi:membrane-associated phospholipid phosphatase